MSNKVAHVSHRGSYDLVLYTVLPSAFFCILVQTQPLPTLNSLDAEQTCVFLTLHKSWQTLNVFWVSNTVVILSWSIKSQDFAHLFVLLCFFVATWWGINRDHPSTNFGCQTKSCAFLTLHCGSKDLRPTRNRLWLRKNRAFLNRDHSKLMSDIFPRGRGEGSRDREKSPDINY